jgi:hypothetical protein
MFSALKVWVPIGIPFLSLCVSNFFDEVSTCGPRMYVTYDTS